MSYILDSLKKSEQKRQENGVPDLNTSHVQDLPVRRSRWPLLLLFALLVIAGLLLRWFDPWSGKEGALQSAVHDTPFRKQPSQTAGLASPLPTVAPVTVPSVSSSSEDSVETISVSGAVNEPLIAREVEKSENSLEEYKTEFEADEKTGSGKDKRLYSPAELPPDIAAQIPAIKVTLHYYSSKPATRMARINGNNLREGSALAPGVIIEEITPDGVVLLVSEYRVWLKKP